MEDKIMSKLLDVLPEGTEDIIKTVLSETDADVIKSVTPFLVVGGLVAYVIKKDKIKDVTALISESKGILSGLVSKVVK